MSICQFTSLFENYSQMMLRQLMSLLFNGHIRVSIWRRVFRTKPVDTIKTYWSAVPRTNQSRRRGRRWRRRFCPLDKDAFSLDSISELDLKGDFMLDVTRGGDHHPWKRKFSPTPKRFKSEPIPPLVFGTHGHVGECCNGRRKCIKDCVK